MRGKRFFIEKNRRIIWTYKRLDPAIRRFNLVCSGSNRNVDIVVLYDEDGEIFREF